MFWSIKKITIFEVQYDNEHKPKNGLNSMYMSQPCQFQSGSNVNFSQEEKKHVYFIEKPSKTDLRHTMSQKVEQVVQVQM